MTARRFDGCSYRVRKSPLRSDTLHKLHKMEQQAEAALLYSLFEHTGVCAVSLQQPL